jgi:formylglycine-generating enzyme required for sulfatase activity
MEAVILRKIPSLVLLLLTFCLSCSIVIEDQELDVGQERTWEIDGMDVILIPAGKFSMGITENDKSSYGVYDMAGNVGKWVNDLWSDNSPIPFGPDSGSINLIKGGDWNTFDIVF